MTFTTTSFEATQGARALGAFSKRKCTATQGDEDSLLYLVDEVLFCLHFRHEIDDLSGIYLCV